MTARCRPTAEPEATPHRDLVQVRGLKVHFPVRSGIFQTEIGTVKAVDGIDFEIRRGETLGLVGESGCGKSTTGRALIRLREPTEGTVTFDGIDLGKLKPEALRKMRRRMQIIFQDPYGSLDPRMTVGSTIAEPIETHNLAKAQSAPRADRGPAADRRARPELRHPLPARVLGRSAPAHRRCAGPCRRAGVHRLRRAHLGARRVDPGAGAEPADRPAQPARADLPVHRPRPVGREAHQRPCRGDVPRQDRRARAA